MTTSVEFYNPEGKAKTKERRSRTIRWSLIGSLSTVGIVFVAIFVTFSWKKSSDITPTPGHLGIGAVFGELNGEIREIYLDVKDPKRKNSRVTAEAEDPAENRKCSAFGSFETESFHSHCSDSRPHSFSKLPAESSSVTEVHSLASDNSTPTPTPRPYPTSPFCYSPTSRSKRRIEFQRLFGPLGYLEEIEQIAHRELSRFAGQSYLDYTGSGVYQERQIIERCNDLLVNAYGNAHSRNPSADLTDQRLREARHMVLDFFKASEKEYSIIFTSGATGALKMVGENFPWTDRSKFFYLRVNHNSVLGIREYAAANGAEFLAISTSDVDRILNEREAEGKQSEGSDKLPHCLFAFPAKDNFAGVLYDLDWIRRVQEFGLSDKCNWHVLLDAAAFVPVHPLDLSPSGVQPDYVCVSFYKMIGYPTGLGTLLLKNSEANNLQKIYWGGGTVVAATCDTRWCRMKDNPSLRFEDGTVSFLAIPAVKYGFDRLKEVGMSRISNHVASLGLYMATEMDAMRHLIGSPVIERYGSSNPRGGIIAFNVLNPDGSYVNFGEVEFQSSAHKIHLRTGCFCNPGACQDYLSLSADDIIDTSVTRDSCSDPATVNPMRALGAVRVSVGYLSTFDDVDTFLEFIRMTYVLQGRSRQGFF